MVAMKNGKDTSDVGSASSGNNEQKQQSNDAGNKSPRIAPTTVNDPSSTVPASPSNSPSSTITTTSSPALSSISSPSLSSSSSLSSSVSSSSNSPAITSKPATSDTNSPKPSKHPTKCPLEKCILCTREQPHCLMRSPTWPAIMRVVFYTLKYNYPEKEFFNLKEDVYSVMLFHWNKLSINKKSSSNWKKHIQDMLSHSKELFESGLEIYGQNGYWRLKVNTDPWTLSGKTRRSPKKGFALKRPLEDGSSDQVLRRPFIPYIAKGANQSSMSYVFVNEHSSPPALPKEGDSSLPFNVPSSLAQRYTFVPATFGISTASTSATPATSSSQPHFQLQIPTAIPTQPSQQLQQQQQQQQQQQPFTPTQFIFPPQTRYTPRSAQSLPSSRRQSPQRSRSPSPQPQSMPTSPRAITPVSAYYSEPTSPRSVPSSPRSRPTSPRSRPSSRPSSPRGSSRASSRRSSRIASPYSMPSSRPSSRPSSPRSMPLSPRSQPLSPTSSSPPSPRSLHALRALRSPPSPCSPPTPQTPLSPPSETNDEALDSLRSTFEQFHWHAQNERKARSEPATPELHTLAFNLFAAAKPANPCDVSFLLNE